MRTCLVRLVARPSIHTQLRRWAFGNTQRRFNSFLEEDEDDFTTFYRPFIASRVEDTAFYIPVAPGWKEDAASIRDGLERFIETEELGNNYEDWLRLLKQKERTGGNDEIWQTWICMRRACVNMPTEGMTATGLWTIFLSNPDLHEMAFSHAVELRNTNGSLFRPLYELIMRHQLSTSSDVESVCAWHQRFKSEYQIPSNALQSLAVHATTSATSLRAFKRIYNNLHKSKLCQYDHIYDQLIPALLRKGMYRQATKWHEILERQNDGPSSAVARTFTLSEFQRFRSEISSSSFNSWGPNLTPSQTATPITLFSPPVADVRKPELPPPSRGLFANLFGGGFDAGGHKEFSDEFCARLFATKALTPAWISAFLEAFGVKKIGPLALRELAIQSESTSQLRMSIEHLRDAGITLGPSTFSRAVAKFAADDEKDLLRGLIHSDQHPDVLEDTDVQRRILTQYLHQGDQQSAHRTLTLLSMFHHEPELKYWNILLRHRVFERNIPEIIRVADEMQLKKVPISGHTLRLSARHLLRQRKRGHRPVAVGKGFDDLTLVTNLVFRGLRAGTSVDEFIWVELFKRHGMAGFSHLYRFCHAMVMEHMALGHRLPPEIFPNQSDHLTMMTSLPFGAGSHMLRRFFSSRRLQYIIEWGFEHALESLNDTIFKAGRHQSTGEAVRYRRWPVDLAPPPSTRTFLAGLLLVQNLAEKGLVVSVDAVQRALKIRLWILYGPGRSRRRKNRTSKALNPYSIVEILDAVDKVWTGPKLFPEVQSLIEGASAGPELEAGTTISEARRFSLARQHEKARINARVMLALFGAQRKAGYRRVRPQNEEWAYKASGLVVRNPNDKRPSTERHVGDTKWKNSGKGQEKGPWASEL